MDLGGVRERGDRSRPLGDVREKERGMDPDLWGYQGEGKGDGSRSLGSARKGNGRWIREVKGRGAGETDPDPWEMSGKREGGMDPGGEGKGRWIQIPGGTRKKGWGDGSRGCQRKGKGRQIQALGSARKGKGGWIQAQGVPQEPSVPRIQHELTPV